MASKAHSTLLRSGSARGSDWKPSRDDWKRFSEETGEHQKALVRLHGILERQHRLFGYRVANEIARFVNLAREQAGDSNGAADAAVDAAFDLALSAEGPPEVPRHPAGAGVPARGDSSCSPCMAVATSPRRTRTVELDGWKVVKGRLVSRPDTQSSSGDGNRDAAGKRSGFRRPGHFHRRHRVPGLPAHRCEGLANAPPTSGPGLHVVYRVTGR